MTSPPSRNHRTLSSLDAGRVLGGASRSTVRRRAETNTLPSGWWAEKERRRQGEQWVFYVPEDDPLLQQWDAARDAPPPEMGPVLDVPPAGRDVPPAPIGPAGDGPYTEPRLTVPEVRDALIAPLVQRLAEVDRQATTRWEALRAASETIGRFRVLVEVAEQKVAHLERDLADATRRATAHETELQRLRATNEKLAHSLAERTHLAEQLQAALKALPVPPAPRRRRRWVAWLLGRLAAGSPGCWVRVTPRDG